MSMVAIQVHRGGITMLLLHHTQMDLFHVGGILLRVEIALDSVMLKSFTLINMLLPHYIMTDLFHVGGILVMVEIALD